MEYLSYLYFYKIYWSIGDLHVVLISAVQQSDSVIHIHIIHIFFIFFSFIIYYRILSIVIQWKKLKVKSLSHVQLFATPWTVAYQASQSMEFSRQEYWSGLSFPWLRYLSVFYVISLHLLVPNSHSISPSPLPPWQPEVCSVCLWICFCFMDKFIYVIF